ncbi:hypothetical protein Bbelb_360200 [Branchiostoma belcheri]|nr:hypothetical protein Bbelb_360200 [Branchiostoma belcheri]
MVTKTKPVQEAIFDVPTVVTSDVLPRRIGREGAAVFQTWLAVPHALGAEGIALSSRQSGYQAMHDSYAKVEDKIRSSSRLFCRVRTPLMFQKVHFFSCWQLECVPAEGIQKFMESELSMDATLSGNVLTTKVGFLGKTIENSNTLGAEGKETGAMSNTIATVWSMEGDYLIAVYPDFDGKGLVVSQKRRFVDDNKIMTEMKAGDLEGWVEYVRC